MTVTVTANRNSYTTAACAACAWDTNELTSDLTIRVAARQHADVTGHAVAILTNTITLVQRSAIGSAEQR